MSWLRLTRIALLPTIAWDFSVGLLLAGYSVDEFPWLAFCALALIYHGSMILNDFADQKQDVIAQRSRPIVNKDIAPLLALVSGLLMYVVAALICKFFYQPVFELCIYLLITVLIYNFSPGFLRKQLGPALLATARAFSLMFGVSALLGPESSINIIAYQTIMAYALYFLFLSRLAQHEEAGIAPMKGLSYISMAALAPYLLLAQAPLDPLVVVSLLAFTALTLRPAIKFRHQTWTPEIVQSLTRSSLCLAPIVLGIALLVSDSDISKLSALVSVAVVLLTSELAKKITIE
jgi:4-hydroxybenzoate polyprenyltransferase